VVTAGDDHTAKVWDATTGKLLLSLEGFTASSAMTILGRSRMADWSRSRPDLEPARKPGYPSNDGSMDEGSPGSRARGPETSAARAETQSSARIRCDLPIRASGDARDARDGNERSTWIASDSRLKQSTTVSMRMRRPFDSTSPSVPSCPPLGR